MVGGCAAAAAYDIHQPFGGKFAYQAAGHFGRFVKTGVAHRVGQTGVRVAANENVGRGAVQFLDVGAHQRCTECTIQPNRQRLRVAHAVPKGGDGLTAQNPPRRIGDRAANQNRQAFAGCFKEFVDGEQRGFGIERIENRFHQQHIRAAFD